MDNIIVFLGYVFIFLILAFLLTTAYFRHYPEQFVKLCVATEASEEACQGLAEVFF